MKKILSVVISLIIIAICLSGCGGNKQMGVGRVYYLNFKPEQDAVWQKLAKNYTDETGIEVTVITAAEGTYESTLTSEMDKSDAPTMFQVNGPVGLANWSSYCYDLTGSEIVEQLTSKEFTLEQDGKIMGVAYVIETYGIIYNKSLLDKYLGSEYASIKTVSEINNFENLSKVVTEIQAHKEELGIDGAFTSSGMDSSSDWRFKTHLANVPLYYEYRDESVTRTEKVKGTYLDNYRAIWDLYINNATCDKTEIASKTMTDAQTEFKTGRAVFYQNGTWEYASCAYDGETGLRDEEFGMLPIYIGVEGEEKQGLCTGTENYWCVNNKASEEDIKATLEFMNWCVASETGTTAMANDMGFVIPFKNAKETDNPLVRIANDYVENGKTPVTWVFSTMPSEDWKNGVGTGLTQYAAGTGNWESVRKAFVEGWSNEFQSAKG